MSEFLDLEGLQSYSAKLKTYIDEKSGGSDNSRELTLEEYSALPEEERNNGTVYYVNNANLSGNDIPGTAGTIKPYVYSEEETIVGIYDNKPLYRKIFNKEIDPMQSLQWYTVEDVSDLNIEKLMTTNLKARDVATISGVGSVDNGVLKVQCYDTWRMSQVTIEYTKTTDAEGSGNNLMPYSAVDASLPFRFGITEDGQYGYYKAGADTVTPFKSGEVGVLAEAYSNTFQDDAVPRTLYDYTYTNDEYFDFVNNKWVAKKDIDISVVLFIKTYQYSSYNPHVELYKNSTKLYDLVSDGRQAKDNAIAEELKYSLNTGDTIYIGKSDTLGNDAPYVGIFLQDGKSALNRINQIKFMLNK